MALRTLKRRVALLVDAIDDDYQVGILRGINRAAEPTNVQLVCIAGGVLGDPAKDPRSLRNFVFDLLDAHQFEGIITLSGSLSSSLGIEGFADFLKRFRGRPIVNLGVQVPGMHSISVAGSAAMRDVVLHSIDVHNHRRIAFIRGPAANEEAEQRFAAYKWALDARGIAFDPQLVLQGTWVRESGALAVRELFGERGVRVDTVRAIACANDYMALGALDVLAERGISVPNDIAVTGFDDLVVARIAVPPLTTVRQPTEALGREGLRCLVSLMNGVEQPLSTELEARIAMRRSCGCAKVDAQSALRSAHKGRSFEAAIIERRTLICAELARVAHGALFGAGAGWEQRLLAALLDDIAASAPTAFVPAIDQIVVKLQRAGGDVGVCQAVLSSLRRAILECASDDWEVLARTEDLFYAARELLAECLVRTEISRKAETVARLRELSQLSALLQTDAELPVLRERFELRLRALGIPAFALGMFAEPGRVEDECVCIAAHSSARRFQLPDTFRASELGPTGLFAQDSGLLIVLPLTFDGLAMGILTLMPSTMDITVLEQLAENLGVGLHGFQLARRARQTPR